MIEAKRHDDSPLVSVVIPAYDVEDYVGDAIRSVFHQSYRNIEIICVDDGSTDGTWHVMEALEQQSPFPYTVVSTVNQGPAQARQEGLSRASGAWVQFLDSDDLLDADKIEVHMKDIARADTRLDVHIMSFRQTELDGRQTVVRVDEREDPLVALYFSRAGITTSMLWCREAIARAGGWDARLPSSEEMDLLFRVLTSDGKARFLDRAHCVRRMRAGSVTTSSSERMWRCVAGLRARVFEHFTATRATGIDDRMRLRMLRLIQRVYDFDPSEAAALQRRTLGDDFSPPLTRLRALPYVAACRSVGLHQAEGWRRRWPRVFVRA
jgi:glycosyltransferase involved in cell wall biosynthesis